MQKKIIAALSLGGLAWLSGCSGEPPLNTIDIARTQYGVLHVKAETYEDLGYGFAYAHAEDNICQMADYFISVKGERARYFGAEGPNAANVHRDLYMRYYLQPDKLDSTYGSMPQNAMDLISGYVAGYNAYLDDTGKENLPDGCRNADWVHPITAHDIYLTIEEKNILMSGLKFLKAVMSATPPDAQDAQMGYMENITPDFSERTAQMGSNGWAFGGDVTEGGYGLLVGNPHFPWQGSNRFYQVHLTIPGEYDVMGTTIPPLPVVTLGFNKDIAWTHTVSNGTRYSLFELTLDPDDPLAYSVDDETYRMKPVTISADVKQADGSLSTVKHTFYETIYGPVVQLPDVGLLWTEERAYALSDVNRLNIDSTDTWLNIGKASEVEGVRAALSNKMGLQWVNTIVADRHGDAMYADITRTPNISIDDLQRCTPSEEAAKLAARRIFVLDGSRSECHWQDANVYGKPSTLPADDMPVLIRRDYVANSNNSYWLANMDAPFEAKAPFVGFIDEPQNLRTRKGLLVINEKIKAPEKISLSVAKEMQFANMNYAAELILDDFLTLCRTEKDYAEACTVLENWDRRHDIESRGAVLFKEIWWQVWDKDIFAIPFDAKDPVNTPAKLDIMRSNVRPMLLDALDTAIKTIRTHGYALDVAWGDVQVFVGKDKRIPVHGGPGLAGDLNVIRTHRMTSDGYIPYHGTSYLQLVTFDEAGPVADAILTYNQSSNPASEHYSDQIELYSNKGLNRLPFHEKDIKADPAYQHRVLTRK